MYACRARIFLKKEINMKEIYLPEVNIDKSSILKNVITSQRTDKSVKQERIQK